MPMARAIRASSSCPTIAVAGEANVDSATSVMGNNSLCAPRRRDVRGRPVGLKPFSEAEVEVGSFVVIIIHMRERVFWERFYLLVV